MQRQSEDLLQIQDLRASAAVFVVGAHVFSRAAREAPTDKASDLVSVADVERPGDEMQRSLGSDWERTEARIAAPTELGFDIIDAGLNVWCKDVWVEVD
jgi:hypothetical protein